MMARMAGTIWIKLWGSLVLAILLMSGQVEAAVRIVSVTPNMVELQPGKAATLSVRGSGLSTIRSGALYRDKAGRQKAGRLNLRYSGSVSSGRLTVTLAGRVKAGTYYIRVADSRGTLTGLPVRVSVGGAMSAKSATRNVPRAAPVSRPVQNAPSRSRSLPENGVKANSSGGKAAITRAAGVKSLPAARSGSSAKAKPVTASKPRAVSGRQTVSASQSVVATGRAASDKPIVRALPGERTNPGQAASRLRGTQESREEQGTRILSTVGMAPGTGEIAVRDSRRNGRSAGSGIAESAGERIRSSYGSPASEASAGDEAPEGFLTDPSAIRAGATDPKKPRQAPDTGRSRSAMQNANLAGMASDADAVAQRGVSTSRSGIAEDANDPDAAVEPSPEDSPDIDMDKVSDTAGKLGQAQSVATLLVKGAGAASSSVATGVSVGLAVAEVTPKLVDDYQNDTADIGTGITLMTAVSSIYKGLMIGGAVGAVAGAVIGLGGAALGALFDMPCQDCDWEKAYVEEQRRIATNPAYAQVHGYLTAIRQIRGNIDPSNYEVPYETNSGSKESARAGFVNPGTDGGGVAGLSGAPRPPAQRGGNIDPNPMNDDGRRGPDNSKPGQGVPSYSASRPSQQPLSVGSGGQSSSEAHARFRRNVWQLSKKIMIARVQGMQHSRNVHEDEVRFMVAEIKRVSQTDFERTKNGDRTWAGAVASRYVARFGQRIQKEARAEGQRRVR